MRRQAVLFSLFCVICTALAVSQATNTFPSSGNVGIGTTSPAAPLDVNGMIHEVGNNSLATTMEGAYLSWNALTGETGETDFINNQGGGSGGFSFMNVPSSGSPRSTLMFLTGSGNLGVGTTAPLAKLDVTGTQTLQNPSGGDYLLDYPLGGNKEDPNTGDIILLIPATTGSAVSGSQFLGVIESNRGASSAWNLNSEWYVSVQSAYTSNTGSILPLSGQQEYASIPTLITCVYNGTTYIGFQTPSGNSLSNWSLTGNFSNGQNSQTPILLAHSSVTNISTLVSYESIGPQISVTGIGPTGNVGIGTVAPGAKLEVDGNVKLTSGSGASMTFADGTTQTTAWTGVLCGGDYAESVDVSGDRTNYSLGDVLVIDPDRAGKFLKSAEVYSTTVMGIYSTRPGVVGRRQTTPKSPEEVPMAMVGIVPAKVSAENGPVRPGDLLVTSSTPGYAMKGTDRTRMLGAVIGKALGSVESGVGVIEVGVTLQ